MTNNLVDMKQKSEMKQEKNKSEDEKMDKNDLNKSLQQEEKLKIEKMRIKETCPSDHQIISPSVLVTDICSFTDEPIRPTKKPDNTTTKTANQIASFQQSRSITRSVRRTKKRDQQGLKRLIRQQKVKQLVNRFISKLKLNNVNSKPIIFQPYEVQQRQSVHSIRGIELPDVYEKILSIFIAFYIMVCLFIDTSASLFPQILSYPMIQIGEYTALLVFLIQFLSSCVVVKMIEGKKVDKITQIITNYVSDGLVIDFAYLIILIVSFFHDVGNLRLIILLKVPECLERIERIQNTYVNTFYKQQYWGLAKVFLLNFVLSHFLSLILILIAKIDPQNSWITKMHFQNSPWFQQYTWGYYWGTTIMLTVGFGDITPGNYKQAICVVIVETFSCLALAYNINCVGNLISNIKSQDIQKNKNIKTFKILSNRNNISEDLQLKIHNYIEESTNIKKKFNFQEESKFISTLPTELKADFLKESNKKIFQNLVFLKNLTQKTLLAMAEVIQMKICHPEEIIKKRGELSGVTILKQGKIAFCTKLMGSDWSNISIDKVAVEENQDPFLLSLDFISLQRSSYEIKSEEYCILYYLTMEQTLQTLKNGQLDYEHFCFLKDRSRILPTQYEVFKCEFCNSHHTKFDCPKLHYTPLKKHVIDRYIYDSKLAKNPRCKGVSRVSTPKIRPFNQLEGNLKIVDLSDDTNNKFTSWKHRKEDVLRKTVSNLTNFGITLKQNSDTLLSNLFNMNSIKTKDFDQKGLKQAEHILFDHMGQQLLKDVLKDQISQAMVKNNEVWLVECDQLKNYKFYFSSFNASTLAYLNKKSASKSLFN